MELSLLQATQLSRITSRFSTKNSRFPLPHVNTTLPIFFLKYQEPVELLEDYNIVYLFHSIYNKHTILFLINK